MKKYTYRIYNRWSKEQLELLRLLYPTASKEYIMIVIPDRSWPAICEAAHRHGLYRSFEVKGKAISAGKGKKK